ncbi:hypothetical protein N7492_006963 [Penicillium capsulatum]|uniref:Atos-like conserved domain-containing protein n=1 Tax=Penicillium capsulatum TaxID=69766 RepID=A0A9W9I1D8_9EURO|nr:hypothetical protein N7492_006963 [Penicillium capsulatum]KAJ6116796.1 hypothetical protein N7512_006521 [Penicillium capsulatum]
MPLFHDPDRRRQYRWSGLETEHEQTPGSSHHSQDKEDHRGLASTELARLNWSSPSRELSPTRMWTNDRQGLIQRIKESSPWRLQYTNPTANVHDSDVAQSAFEEPQESVVRDHASGDHEYKEPTEELGSPADIQRPRSALHSGDFNEAAPQIPPQSPRPHFAEPSHATPFPRLDTSPTTPWLGASAFQPPVRRSLFGDQYEPGIALETRSRAPSLGSFSSSYVLKAPTSPLVHQANNTDLDFSPRVDSAQLPEPTDRANRRRTLPPETFRHLEPSPANSQSFNFPGPLSPEKDDSLLHQHSPRRTLTSAYSLQLASGGNASAFRARRPSLASEISPRPHAPMVGSYEESILRGRMSMNPSKPLDFTAQIGVLGKGKCKGHLKCPPHVTVPFPAVFYSYPTSGNGRSISDDSPSPYVGQIDLEGTLSKEDPGTTKRRKRHYSPVKAAQEDGAADQTETARVPDADTRRRREKKSRRTESPKCPPGGCYRIPQQGQLQIIIKNPNKTAVKLFLVPYDLTDMEPGTKTFIRQRSYSAGPIIDMPLDARKNFGTDRPEASLSTSTNPHDKPTLRYLIHINICCPARGRFYLHSSMRVVFANRVPDGKEKLRNEIQLPEPRYSPYKPTRESTLSTSAGARLAIEKASRRRSAGQGTITLLRPHVSSPGDIPMHWTAADSTDFPPSHPFQQGEDPFYSKLNKGDAGYGGHAFFSGQVSPDTGESLLAKRLRGLDVHRQKTFDSK